MDETAEQVLARLERHVELVRSGALARTATRTWDMEPDRHALAEPSASGSKFGILTRTVAGQVTGVLACVAALAVWMRLSPAVAAVVIGVPIAGFAVAAYRRIPLCGWCTLGLVAGLALGRFS